MTANKVEIDKQQLNDTETGTSSDAPRPVDGKHVLIHSRN